MNCQFCKKEAPYKPLEEMEKLEVKVYFCFTCNAEYLVWKNGSLGSISLYTIINKKMYRWTDNLHGTVSLNYVKEPGEPGVRTNKLENILVLGPEVPKPSSVTPDNVEDKIRNYLIFS